MGVDAYPACSSFPIYTLLPPSPYTLGMQRGEVEGAGDSLHLIEISELLRVGALPLHSELT